MTPLGIARLSDNRDHPLCLSQGRSTRSCSGAPQKHPSPADARSKIEGVALPPIDAFTRRAERRGPTPSPGPAAPPNFFPGSHQARCISPPVIPAREAARSADPSGQPLVRPRNGSRSKSGMTVVEWLTAGARRRQWTPTRRGLYLLSPHDRTFPRQHCAGAWRAADCQRDQCARRGRRGAAAAGAERQRQVDAAAGAGGADAGGGGHDRVGRRGCGAGPRGAPGAAQPISATRMR